MSTIESTFDKILFWAKERNLIKGSTPMAQFIKLISEFGELCEHLYYAEENLIVTEKIKDDIGDCSVVLRILSAQMHINFEEILYIDTIPYRGDIEQSRTLLLGQTLGSMADSILKNDIDTSRTMIGLSLHFLQEIAQYHGFDYIDCVKHAYNDIKDRKGVMYNGAFIKSTDAHYAEVLKALQVELNGEVTQSVIDEMKKDNK